ncbi:hypothetical protein VP01_620g8 [Puccinia sorghi]|uniref:Stress response RCI peptide n=1 Tax=Puccinia sorghi TaxID=27349 RepID=A0A0L6UGP2_9BASI|nr:hypothetical protein VP01_620g8 [Puccinia sorghi]
MARSTPSSTTDVLLYFLAVFVPPASVFIKLGWIPGVIHAWWIVSKYPDPQPVLHNSIPNHYGAVPPK